MSNKKSARARRREQLERRKRERQTKWIIIGAGLLVVVVVGSLAAMLRPGSEEEPAMADGNGSFMEGDRPLADLAPEQRDGYYSAYPEQVIDPDKEYEAVIQTDVGDMRVRLFASDAPQTVNNFVYLANQGFYDQTTFHRVIDNFMAQGGDPSGSGRGGPGYRFADEFQSGQRFNRPGLLAMANAGPGTNGSQFFITFVPTPHLDNRHTIFGEVVDGSEVLSQITRRDPNSPRPGTVIERIDIYEGE